MTDPLARLIGELSRLPGIGPKTAETAAEFGLRVDVQPETAAVGPLVEALAEHAARLRAEGALPPPRKSPRRR